MHTQFRARSLTALALALAAVAGGTLTAQIPNRLPIQRPNGMNNNGQRGDNNNSQAKAPPPLPNDDRLMALHRRFVQDAEKLAAEYEQKKQHDKAAAVYREMLKLVPAYRTAQESLAKIEAEEAVANQIAVSIEAKEKWQDTGIRLIAGKPIAMACQGSWTVKLSHEVGPDGIDLDMLPKNCKLGQLIGVIVTPGEEAKNMKPFPIGSKSKIVAERSGSLWVAMCDIDHHDNAGKVTLNCVGRFDFAK